MIKIGVSPKLNDFIDKSSTFINTWFREVTNRFSIQRLVGSVDSSEVPENQWGVFYNEDNDMVTLSTNINGRLTQVPIEKGPACMARHTSIQSIPDSTWTKIQMQKYWASGKRDGAVGLYCWDDFNYRFVPDLVGLYQVDVQINVQTTCTQVQLALYKNGSLYRFGTQGINGRQTSLTCLVEATSLNDYFEVYVYQVSGGAVNTAQSYVSLGIPSGADCFFHAFYVRPVNY